MVYPYDTLLSYFFHIYDGGHLEEPVRYQCLGIHPRYSESGKPQQFDYAVVQLDIHLSNDNVDWQLFERLRYLQDTKAELAAPGILEREVFFSHRLQPLPYSGLYSGYDIVDWARVPLAHFLSIDKPIEKGWALPLLAWFFNWPTVIFYLWLFTGCYYLSARFKKIGFLVIVPFALNALYVFAVLLDFSVYLDWMPYLAILLAVGTVFNIRLGYRQFQKLEVVLKLTPKTI